MIDVVGRQSLDPEQMAVRERGLGGTFLHEPETIGSGSARRNRHGLNPRNVGARAHVSVRAERRATSEPEQNGANRALLLTTESVRSWRTRCRDTRPSSPVAVPRQMFQEILMLIAQLRAPPAPA